MAVNPRADPLKNLEDKFVFLEREIMRLEKMLSGLEKKITSELDKLRDQEAKDIAALEERLPSMEDVSDLNQLFDELRQQLSEQDYWKADRNHKHSARRK